MKTLHLLTLACAAALMAACGRQSNHQDTLLADKTTELIATNAFDEGLRMCQMACGVTQYDEADVVAFTDAKIGDITQCPVSGAIYKVKENSPVLTYEGHEFFACCEGCAEKFKENPSRFVKVL